MNRSEVTFDAPPKILRQFAVLWLVLLGSCAAWNADQGRPVSAAVWCVAAFVVGVLGVVRPRSIRHVYGAALAATFPIGWCVSQLLLAVLFFGLVTPMAVVSRLIGRDILRRRRREQASYWSEKTVARDIQSYFQQF